MAHPSKSHTGCNQLGNFEKFDKFGKTSGRFGPRGGRKRILREKMIASSGVDTQIRALLGWAMDFLGIYVVYGDCHDLYKPFMNPI